MIFREQVRCTFGANVLEFFRHINLHVGGRLHIAADDTVHVLFLHMTSRPTARDLRPQVEDQGGAYETEADTRRDYRDQHSRREAGKDNE